MLEVPSVAFDVLKSLVPGLLIALVSSWITVRLSLRRFRAERWWDRKADAYQRIIAALHDVKVVGEIYRHETTLPVTQVSNEKWQEKRQELRQRLISAGAEINRSRDLSAFVLSEEAADRLKKYQREINALRETADPLEEVDDQLEVIEKCLNDFIQIARRDLGVR